MNWNAYLIRKFCRFLLTMTGFAVLTAFILLAAVPGIGKTGTVSAAVLAALVIAMYDFGMFGEDFLA